MVNPERNVVGVYDSEQDAILAIEGLIRQGYDKQDICVIGKNLKHVNYIADETGTVAEESAATGALAGGTLGGLTGFLVGVGALAIPGVGPIVAAGPIASSLIGAVAGAGLGGLTGALVTIGIPDHEAEYYGNSVKEGKILVLTKNGHPDNLNDNHSVAEANVTHDWGKVEKLDDEIKDMESTEDLQEKRRIPNPLQ
ncbi:general stress protein [Neobacillus niacini]|jgi:uncharacterized membrane protein|uniref:general stress protein n=1 Tax=Neobacillus niacini TaxID=86668 RepID=UPI002FFEC4F1